MTVEEKKAYVQNGGTLVDSRGNKIKLIDNEPRWLDGTSGPEPVHTLSWERDDWMMLEYFLLKLLGVDKPNVGQIHKAKVFIESIQADELFNIDRTAINTAGKLGEALSLCTFYAPLK